jgi:glyceraldehyde 3-phosphate dehydrogenase
VKEVNRYLEEAAEAALHGILGFEKRPLVSVDFLNDTRSSIVDGPSTMVVDGSQVKVIAWYDNEWGYVNRLVELGAKVASSLAPAARSAAAGQ